MLNIIKFETRFKPGGGAQDFVLVAPQGAGFDKTRTWHRVDKIRPPANPSPEVRDSLSFIDMDAKWQIIGPAYEAWKTNNEIPEVGTPLGAWAALTQEQAEHLKKQGIRTVEDVASMNDRTIEALGWPDARKLPPLAAKYLEGADDSEKDRKLAEMEERLAAMQELLEEQMKQEPPKRGPGRPKKDEAA